MAAVLKLAYPCPPPPPPIRLAALAPAQSQNHQRTVSFRPPSNPPPPIPPKGICHPKTWNVLTPRQGYQLFEIHSYQNMRGGAQWAVCRPFPFSSFDFARFPLLSAYSGFFPLASALHSNLRRRGPNRWEMPEPIGLDWLRFDWLSLVEMMNSQKWNASGMHASCNKACLPCILTPPFWVSWTPQNVKKIIESDIFSVEFFQCYSFYVFWQRQSLFGSNCYIEIWYELSEFLGIKEVSLNNAYMKSWDPSSI